MTSEPGALCETVQVRLELGEPLSPEETAHVTGCRECRGAAEVSRALHGILGGPQWTAGERVVDQYEILEQLGRGGQGVVYKARDLETGLIVALKVVAQDAHAVDEVLHAAGITHPNVCRINYTKSMGPFRVIVMEYVRGSADVATLRDLLARVPVPKREALEIFRGICAGVKAAHERDVLHLDLKPGNVLLRDGKVPVVSDFGLATVSGSGTRGGTPGYMAPEQERGDEVDQRTDVFALGVILSELIPRPDHQLRSVIEGATRVAMRNRISSVDELLRLVEAKRAGAPVVVVVAVGVLAVGLVAWRWRPHTTATPEGAEAGTSQRALASDQAAPSPPTSTAQVSNLPQQEDPRVAPQPTSATNAVRRGTPSTTAIVSPSVTASTSPATASAATATRTSTTCHPSLIQDCRRLCDLDDAASCYNAARYYLQNFSDAAGAAGYFKRSCDGRFMDGCVDLGVLHENGRGVTKDFTRAADLYRTACDVGVAHGCNNLGVLYGSGNGVAKDYVQAAKLFSRACDGGDPEGCGNLGVCYRDGDGVTVDKPHASELLKRACKANEAWCNDYHKLAKGD